MRVKILKITPQSEGGNKVTVRIKDTIVALIDPQDKADGELRDREVEVKICGLHGKAHRSKGPAGFDAKKIVAKVLERDVDCCTLDCELFSFDYLMNFGEEDEFVVGEYVTLEGHRLDIML